MVSEVVEFVQDVPVPLGLLWDALVDPETYSRLFTGIGGCERQETVADSMSLLFRIGSPECGVVTVPVRLVPGRRYDSLELHSPTLGSMALIRLRAQSDGTRVAVTVFAPKRLHPVIASKNNAAVVRWLRDGIEKVAQRCLAVPTAVCDGTSRSPVRRKADVVRQLVAAGVVRPHRLDHGLGQLHGLARWGISLAGGYAAAAACAPQRTAIIDERVRRSFAELHRRTDDIARALLALGLDGSESAGLLARNHIGMVETMVAAGKAGLELVLLHPGMAARQLENVSQRQRLSAVFVDDELESLVHYLHPGITRFRTDRSEQAADRTTLDELATLAPETALRRSRPGRLVVLTSGSSGAPKGARRPRTRNLDPVAAILSRIPLRMEENMLIAAPLCHTWGLAMLQLGTALRATVVLPRRLDPEECLRSIAEHRVTTVVTVPPLLHRILELPAHVRARYDTSSVKIVASGSAPLSGATVVRFMDVFGDVLYNVYGSTEVSWATIATPHDLRQAPATVGRPPMGTTVAVLGPDLRPLPVGATGRIFVANPMLFDGYVNAPPPAETEDGMLDTGDIGYIDVAGRLFICGRGDEMIISGGEKVFPRPLEEALEYLPQVREAAVVGVPDREFGQRTAAFVVTREGSGLDARMVRDYLRTRHGRTAVPRDVSFVPALPRGETGKIVKRLLPAPESPKR
ncbi:acyl-CoA synthetase [Nocardia sp. 852002-20019_SCH5090214]|uniref:AMP-binding protein n=1 Tax=Nocardia sp. 852002-20019_SCH5090214 TaxID=1834087 RepID=UPI0007E9683B|nr:AMP-binding protein [Nocardia sp. 852002-20019_SCH5090214]OBA45659.1 acyl-CoA synthetase [Nocardia sp. 852002-20019_SCH5090214]